MHAGTPYKVHLGAEKDSEGFLKSLCGHYCRNPVKFEGCIPVDMVYEFRVEGQVFCEDCLASGDTPLILLGET